MGHLMQLRDDPSIVPSAEQTEKSPYDSPLFFKKISTPMPINDKNYIHMLHSAIDFITSRSTCTKNDAVIANLAQLSSIKDAMHWAREDQR